MEISHVVIVGLSITSHEVLEPLASEDQLLQFFSCLKNRAGDALAVAIHLIQKPLPEDKGALLYVSLLVVRLLNKPLETERIGDLHKGLLRRAQQSQQSSEPSGVFLGAKEDIYKANGGLFRLLAEEEPLGDQIDGAIHLVLKFNQIRQGVSLGLYKPAVKPFPIHQRQEGCTTGLELTLEKTRCVRIRQGFVAAEMIEVCQGNANKAGEALPKPNFVFKADLWKREPFGLVPYMIKQIFEVTFVFGHINDNRFVLEGL